ncbi:MAG: FRG domain-containing protein [Solobacterium sp.]|nr:FRG domain-containing protein [Solobacterium sp.]
MITVRHIKDIAEIGPIICDQTLDAEKNRYRSGNLYKGLCNGKWELTTSLFRCCTVKKDELETTILRSFTKYASYVDPALQNSVWRQLIIGKHHGLPTRMLDWTYSPLVGLHFATGAEPDKLAKHDAVLWKIDADELQAKLPDKYKKVMHDYHAHMFTLDMLEQCAGSLAEYDLDMQDSAIVLMEPPSIDQRIITQYANFAIIPKGIEKADGSYTIEQYLNDNTQNTVKYIIDRSLVWRLRDMLDQMNINERMIYPGLDGLSMWLKRHYYVIPD